VKHLLTDIGPELYRDRSYSSLGRHSRGPFAGQCSASVG
jgi:hypothetical protein